MAKAMTRRAASVGVSDHGGWAVLVTLSPEGELLDRRRVELLDAGLPSFPHHHEGQWAMGRYLEFSGGRKYTLPEVFALIERVRGSALRCARARLATLASEIAAPIASISLRACPALPATTEERIADQRAQTIADPVMYRQAIATAAEERGWAVHWFERDEVLERSAQALRKLERTVGRPWNVDHKLATAAALVAQASARR